MNIFGHLRPDEVLRASHISRWGIVQTHKQQNIAEHMYRVWVLCRHIGPLVLDGKQQRDLEELALVHDLPEIRTGDSPTSIKTKEFKEQMQEIEEAILPGLTALENASGREVVDVLKVCDILEAILFLGVNGAGSHARDVTELLGRQMQEKINRSAMSEHNKNLISVAANKIIEATL